MEMDEEDLYGEVDSNDVRDGSGASGDDGGDGSIAGADGDERERTPIIAPVAPRRYGTRATNASQHPGLIDCDSDGDEGKGKRSKGKERATQVRSAKTKAAAIVDAKDKANRIAALEDKIRLTEQARDATAARPPPGKVIVKTARPAANRGDDLMGNRGKQVNIFQNLCDSQQSFIS